MGGAWYALSVTLRNTQVTYGNALPCRSTTFPLMAWAMAACQPATKNKRMKTIDPFISLFYFIYNTQ